MSPGLGRWLGVCVISLVVGVAPIESHAHARSSKRLALVFDRYAGRISLEAAAVPWPEFLSEWQRRTGIRLRVMPPPREAVWASFRDLAIPDAVKRLFGPVPDVVLIYATPSGSSGATLPVEAWVRRQQRPRPGNASPAVSGSPGGLAEPAAPPRIGASSDGAPTVKTPGDAASEADLDAPTALVDPDPDVRRRAVDALVELGGEQALQILRNALPDGGDEVATGVARALAEAWPGDDVNQPLAESGETR